MDQLECVITVCQWRYPFAKITNQIQPYDPKYLEENKIKHMSFHAYLKQSITQNKTAPVTSDQFVPPLDDYEFKIKTPCPSKTHGPFLHLEYVPNANLHQQH